jgi:hypothetical protein
LLLLTSLLLSPEMVNGVPDVVGIPACCCWLHYFFKRPCFCWHLYCVGAPAVACVTAVARVPDVASIPAVARVLMVTDVLNVAGLPATDGVLGIFGLLLLPSSPLLLDVLLLAFLQCRVPDPKACG